MAQLTRTKRGWDNEHLATFLLSQISFIANPIKVADDIGSDLFCTIFEARAIKRVDLLFPRNSFAIQIKSRATPIRATNKIEYLVGLEVPFFVGIVDRGKLQLSIHSGEYLPVMFSRGHPRGLTLVPTAPGVVSSALCEGNPSGGNWRLLLPHVCDVSPYDTAEALRETAERMSRRCQRIHGNISARANKEYIFSHDDENQKYEILAGPSSVQTFRRNFCLRLAEVFANFEWMLNWRGDRHPQLDSGEDAEFQLYNRLYEDLALQSADLPWILHDRYEAAARAYRGKMKS